MFALLGRGLRGVWRLLDGTRRLLMNLLLLLLAAGLVWALVTRGGPTLQDKTVLVLDLRGPVVEQRSGTWSDAALGRARGQRPQQVQLRDVLRVLDAAATDPKISQVLLLLDDFRGAGLATLRELSAAVQRFKASGKTVVAWGSSFDQRQYHVAAAASEVLLHPMGMVQIEGYGRLRNYYRDALDKLGVTVNLIRVGTYKSFGETFTENGPSAASIEAERLLYGGLWATYTADVEAARKLPAGALATRHRRTAAAPGRGRRRPGAAGPRCEAGGRSEDARRAARDADRTRRPRRPDEELSPGGFRGLPVAPVHAAWR